MAKGSGSNGSGAVTRPTGQASPAKSSGGGRGFTPPGAKGGGGGPSTLGTKAKPTPASTTSANKVQGKG